jgi:uncharacterized membrane protein YdbT with pleckstrin-like domain
MISDLQHSFPGQETDEAVFVFARPYPVAFLPTALVFGFLFTLSIVVELSIVNGFLGNFSAAFNSGVILFLGVFQLLAIIIFLVALLDFYYDILIVTDRRVIDIDQEQLFFRRINELSLEDIEDVSSQTQGFLQDVFGFGNVEIQTAGAKNNFEIKNVYHPREIAVIILDLSEKAKRGITEHLRIPSGSQVGVINNRLLKTPQELMAAGALNPTDTRRNPGNAFD